jgi:type IV pilus assembly protein PilN
MIRINLFPEHHAKKGKGADPRIELGIGAAVLVVATGACMFYSGLLDDEIARKQGEKQEKTKQLAALKEKAKLVEDFEQKKKALEEKNRIIEQLEKSRGGPVRVLDYISQSLESQKLWLVSLNVKDKDIEIDGKALANDDVVNFVSQLRRTDYFSAIRLTEVNSGVEGKFNVYQFRVTLTLKG